jgi:glycosyltransferase involved in cell wall biosynthesis
MDIKFSIIIPTFNRAHLIAETIRSFVNQSYSNWEIIVVDDGATDNTPELVQSYNDPRIQSSRRSSQHDKGPSGCRNYGLSLAKGEYILFFDDDDIAHPDLLSLCMEQFSQKDIDFCRYLREVFYNDFDIVFDSNTDFDLFEITEEDLEAVITNKLPFNTCAVIWKKTCFKGERFNEELFYSDEWEFYQRVLSSNVKGVSLKKVLLFARKHTVSSTNNFLNSNSKYLNSTRKAMKLVIQNLHERGKLSPELIKYFIRNGFALKDKSIIEEVLNRTKAKTRIKLKYLFGYRIYPILKPIFYLKGKIFKN